MGGIFHLHFSYLVAKRRKIPRVVPQKTFTQATGVFVLCESKYQNNYFLNLAKLPIPPPTSL